MNFFFLILSLASELHYLLPAKLRKRRRGESAEARVPLVCLFVQHNGGIEIGCRLRVAEDRSLSYEQCSHQSRCGESTGMLMVSAVGLHAARG